VRLDGVSYYACEWAASAGGEPCGVEHAECTGGLTCSALPGDAGSFCLPLCVDESYCCDAECLAAVDCVLASDIGPWVCAPSDPGGPHAACVGGCDCLFASAGAATLCDLCASEYDSWKSLCNRSFTGYLKEALRRTICPVVTHSSPQCPTLDCAWACSAVGM
jgi:hypothetical protein